MKKTIIYLDGRCYENKNEERLKILNKQFNVIEPIITKDNKDNLYVESEKIIKENKIEAIVGISTGGYIGYYLSNTYKIPALLLNPALNCVPILREQKMPKQVYNSDEFEKQILVLGINDVVVNPMLALKIIEHKNNIYKVDIEHQIPLDVFKKYLKLFIDEKL